MINNVFGDSLGLAKLTGHHGRRVTVEDLLSDEVDLTVLGYLLWMDDGQPDIKQEAEEDLLRAGRVYPIKVSE